MRGEGKASRKFVILSLLTLQVIGKVRVSKSISQFNQFPSSV